MAFEQYDRASIDQIARDVQKIKEALGLDETDDQPEAEPIKDIREILA